jgi:hypothetical protein
MEVKIQSGQVDLKHEETLSPHRERYVLQPNTVYRDETPAVCSQEKQNFIITVCKQNFFSFQYFCALFLIFY